jgi:4'-phosphopantetheinyl transferase
MVAPDNCVELWFVDLDACAPALAEIERSTPRLSPEDSQRAGALADPRERCRRRAAYTALRLAIERLAGPAVRGEPFTRDTSGKPTLPARAIAFSLAHTGDLALIGVTRLAAIGVDLEKSRPIHMSPHHVAEICAAGAGLGRELLPRAGTQRTFLQAWVRLEAFTKARGHTLQRSLSELGLRNHSCRPSSPAEIRVTARRLARNAGLHVVDLGAPLGIHAAVATPYPIRSLRFRHFPSDSSELERLEGQELI